MMPPDMLEGGAYPKPWPLFWAASALATGYLFVALAVRWRGWARGLPLGAAAPAPRGRILGIWVAEALGQRQILRISRVRWLAHLAISCGFCALGLLSIFHVLLQTLDASGSGLAAWLLRGGGRLALKGWGNAAGLALLAGLLLALARRLARPPVGAADADERDSPLVLSLLCLTMTGFLLEGLRLAAGASAAAAQQLRPWLTALWTVHGLGGVALVAWLPNSRLLHAALAPLVVALNARAEHGRKDLSWPPPPKLKAS
jgi:nitrate reductase gamma subunit